MKRNLSIWGQLENRQNSNWFGIRPQSRRCDKLPSNIARIKIISAVINRSIKLNLIINSTRFSPSLVPIFIESQSQHTERMNEKKNNSLGWWRWLIPFWRRFNHPPLSVDSLRCATFWWSFFIFARLVSTSSRVVIKRWWLFYKHKNDTRTTAENERPACELKRGEKRSDLVVPYGDQVMLAQALQKTFPNVFFFFFFDIKYQHFKNKIFLPCPV